MRGDEMRKVMSTLILVLIILTPVISSALSVGDKAPGFEVPSTHGTVILSVGCQSFGNIEAEQHHTDRSLVNVRFDRAVPVDGSQLPISGSQRGPKTEISGIGL